MCFFIFQDEFMHRKRKIFKSSCSRLDAITRLNHELGTTTNLTLVQVKNDVNLTKFEKLHDQGWSSLVDKKPKFDGNYIG